MSVKEKGIQWITKNILNSKQCFTNYGSLNYLLFGKQPSYQSIVIKMGYFGQFIIKEIIQSNTDFELIKCGVQQLNNVKKDVDIAFIDKVNNVLWYFEMKSNIDLDTEKIDATITKCNQITSFYKENNPNLIVNYGLLHWSVYDDTNLQSNIKHKINMFCERGVKVYHMYEFMQILPFNWEKEDYYNYFLDIGKIIRNH
jgi:hypothetical protein